jgi:hypothetical protein
MNGRLFQGPGVTYLFRVDASCHVGCCHAACCCPELYRVMGRCDRMQVHHAVEGVCTAAAAHTSGDRSAHSASSMRRHTLHGRMSMTDCSSFLDWSLLGGQGG